MVRIARVFAVIVIGTGLSVVSSASPAQAGCTDSLVNGIGGNDYTFPSGDPVTVDFKNLTVTVNGGVVLSYVDHGAFVAGDVAAHEAANAGAYADCVS